MPDHVHMCLSIPPKLAVSNAVGFIKGKSAISIARQFRGDKRILMVRPFGLGAITFPPTVSAQVRGSWLAYPLKALY